MPRFASNWPSNLSGAFRRPKVTGLGATIALGRAWLSRYYLVNSFNKDRPLDRLLAEQLAGDFLPARTPDERHENALATAFLHLGERDWQTPLQPVPKGGERTEGEMQYRPMALVK